MTSLRLEARLPNGPDAPAVARRVLDGIDLYVGAEDQETLKLLVTELVTNSVRHGDADPAETIALRVTTTHERIHVEVIDQGKGFRQPDRVIQAGSKSAGGWGLYLTDRLASDWGVKVDGSTCVWFDMFLRSNHRSGGHSPSHQGRADRRSAVGGRLINQRRPLRRSTAR